MASSLDFARRDLQTVWQPCTRMKVREWLPMIPIVRGEGAGLHDADGRRYLDAIGSWWVNLFGHADPRIAAAEIDGLVATAPDGIEAATCD